MTGTRVVAERPLRLRPRSGRPRSLVEHLGQFAFRYRQEILLFVIATATVLGVLAQLAVI